MSHYPLISFVVPAYNVEKHIPKTLSSLLSQTCKDFEIIVVDDGSTDSTYNVVKEILEKSGFPNYTILRKPNGGVSSARNMGIRHARGKYIIFLDGDDYVAPELVEKVKEVLSKDDVDMVCWKFQCVDETGKPTKYQFPLWGLKEGQTYTGLQVLEKILIERSFWIWTASTAYSKEVIIQNNLFYNEEYCIGEDQGFIYKCLGSSHRVCFIDGILSYYVQRLSSSSKMVNVKQFGSYLAIVEVRTFLSQKFERNEILELLKALQERAILDFLMWLRKHSASLKWPSYRRIEESINSAYPGLLKRVLSDARTNGKLLVKVKPLGKIGFEIFRLSPRLYVWLSWMLDKIERVVSKRS